MLELLTEGQGIDGYPAKYNPLKIAISFGVGFKYTLRKRFHFSMAIGLHKTIINYLDELSDDYAPLNILWANNGLLSRDLSNRSYNVQGKQIEQAGTPRRYTSKEGYTFVELSLPYSFQQYGYLKKRPTRYETI